MRRSTRTGGAVLLLIAAGCTGRFAPPCRLDGVPLPTGISVSSPARALDPKLAAYTGAWEGQWNGSRASALIVEEIDAERATVAYGVEAAGSARGIFARDAVRTTARVLPDGRLRFGTAPIVLTFTITDDLRSLHGTHETSGGLDGEVTMRRCERTLRAPTE